MRLLTSVLMGAVLLAGSWLVVRGVIWLTSLISSGPDFEHY